MPQDKSTATLQREVVAGLQQRVRELEEALAPFARFWDQWERQPMLSMADTIYAIHTGTDYEAELRRSDCRRASELLRNRNHDGR